MKRINGAENIHPIFKDWRASLSFQPRCLFAGDDDVDRAAPYMLSMLHHAGVDVDYVCSCEEIPLEFSSSERLKEYHWIIISDFPPLPSHSDFFQGIVEACREGVSFTMIGGWESFAGNGDFYVQNPIVSILPVDLRTGDDRFNSWQGILLESSVSEKKQDPFDRFWSSLEWKNPPAIAGCNVLNPKPDSEILLQGRPLRISVEKGKTDFQLDEALPLWVSHSLGRSQSSALAFDMAPHWIAGGVDWSKNRHKLLLGKAAWMEGTQKIGAFPQDGDVWVELGESYMGFFGAMLAFHVYG